MKSILSIFSPKTELCPLQSLALVPDRPSLIYHAGELVSGHIVITVNGQLDISQVKIALKGHATVCVPVGMPEQQRHKNRTNGMVVTHLKKDVGLLDMVYNPATVYNQTLISGRHDIGFSFMLPPSVPSSLVSSEYGGIEYNLEASIQGFPDKTTSTKLTVLSDPATTPESLSSPVIISNEKYVGLLSGKRLFMKCQLPKTGWTLGSTLPINVKVENESRKFMALKCMLKQEIHYIYDSAHTKIVANRIAFADGPQIEPRTNVEHNLHLQVPLNLPIIQNTCPLIQIIYQISVKLDIRGSFDLQVKLPIILTQTSSMTHGPPVSGIGMMPQHPYPVQGYVPGTLPAQPQFPIGQNDHHSMPVIDAPPPYIFTTSTSTTVTNSVPSTVPYPSIDYGMPQPAFNPSVPVADEAMPMPSKSVRYPQLN